VSVRSFSEVRSPLVKGALFAIASALAFGATTPLVQRFGRDAGPFWTAFALYAGAAATAALGGSSAESRPRRAHLPRLALVAIAGAAIAPIALAWGLQRTSATSASLMLNLEALFTIALAHAFYAEPIGPRVALAALAMVAGGALLVVRDASSASAAGTIAVVVATAAWAADNALTRPLADLDPARVVAAKGALGAALTALLAMATRDRIAPLDDMIALGACGATGYGASLRLYLLAQRRIGAARTGSLFAIAPFVGAAVAFALGERTQVAPTIAAASLFALGVALHLSEKHAHVHTHDAIEHDHAHRHDDGHHDHTHHPAVPGAHSHMHRHAETTHAHDHAPDAHHAHRH
jgi:drug/metabolite transporter (DMT)-like permease